MQEQHAADTFDHLDGKHAEALTLQVGMILSLIFSQYLDIPWCDNPWYAIIFGGFIFC